MAWMPLAERFVSLPLILAGPVLRRVEPQSVTVWLALKEPRRVTLRVYAKNEAGQLLQQVEGTQRTIRLGEHLHVVVVTASVCADTDTALRWGESYCYDLFFQTDERFDALASSVPETAAHLGTAGILNADPAEASACQRFVYDGHELPSFVLPPEDVSRLRVLHGSCRKPHGTGKDMLSAVDTLLEAAVREGRNRPQQLFLTGDQIYADDVAAPLLFALIDAGNCLFAGNEKEVLPGMELPACSLAPGTRADIVRKAMFTTTTPQNHLLALREYATMYLFIWSDTLWPTALPDVQELWDAYPQARPTDEEARARMEREYNTQLKGLQTFRASLPQVRRALANIATYTIFDDHDITDDWFLDGAWCQHVLENPLGRRIIRNGLLAYTLFQGWGNTPRQFAETQGQALLAAIDSWRGEESGPWEAYVESLLGLPIAFSGSGELQRSPQALHWHHRYEGLHYQVFLLDTRTQRHYHSSHDFPGLLSEEAMYTQIGQAAREDVEVTLLISATPVLGMDFIESIQLWSHWFVKENYAYDCEAWALEWNSFQRLLKMISGMKRVVILSGDVHYAFGSSMEYWDQHTHSTARLVNYTSSSFHNEGTGAHISILAIGYPRLLHLLRHQGTPTVDFLAWDIAPGDFHIQRHMLSLIRRRIFLFWWAIPRWLAIRRSPYEIVMPARGWLKGAFHSVPPDRVYRLRYLRNTLIRVNQRKRDRVRARTSSWILRVLRIPLGVLTLIETSARRLMRSLLWRIRRDEQVEQIAQKKQSEQGIRSIAPEGMLAREAARGTHKLEDKLEREIVKPRRKLVTTLLNYIGWSSQGKAGELVVAYNNLGEVYFAWTETRQAVVQRLWYADDDNATAHLLRHTDYYETLELPRLDTAPLVP